MRFQLRKLRGDIRQQPCQIRGLICFGARSAHATQHERDHQDAMSSPAGLHGEQWNFVLSVFRSLLPDLAWNRFHRQKSKVRSAYRRGAQLPRILSSVGNSVLDGCSRLPCPLSRSIKICAAVSPICTRSRSTTVMGGEETCVTAVSSQPIRERSRGTLRSRTCSARSTPTKI